MKTKKLIFQDDAWQDEETIMKKEKEKTVAKKVLTPVEELQKVKKQLENLQSMMVMYRTDYENLDREYRRNIEKVQKAEKNQAYLQALRRDFDILVQERTKLELALNDVYSKIDVALERRLTAEIDLAEISYKIRLKNVALRKLLSRRDINLNPEIVSIIKNGLDGVSKKRL